MRTQKPSEPDLPAPTDHTEGASAAHGFHRRFMALLARAGQRVIEPALWLYFASQDQETPRWAKTTVYGALAYLLLPTDLVADLAPVVGYTDDLSVILAATATVASHIKPEHRIRARDLIQRLLPAAE